MKLLISGSRSFNNYEKFKELFNLYKLKPTEIIVGDAIGVDSLAIRFAKESNIPYKVFKADWKQYGKLLV